MMRALYISATGMQAQDKNISTITQNLSNINTNGYKKRVTNFEDLLYQTLREPGTELTDGISAPTGIQLGNGVRVTGISKINTQGGFQITDNPFDLAIEGEGFFQIQLPNGSIGYTRDGAFRPDANGQLVNASGLLLDPPITVPQDAESVTVGTNGVVSVIQGDNQAAVQVGQIQTVRFINPGGMKNQGRNIATETIASGAPLQGTPGQGEFGTIAQGSLETSNVTVVDEMVNLITAQRAYESNSKGIQTADSMLQTANGLKR
ncbi:MAG: flagellar basal-body rod protein FlgG [Candidatus Cloacimonadota bacterium]|nr:MAG: flagellar basal-body rod protein FlgG [Candidatus Cloacimonadota bacterium]